MNPYAILNISENASLEEIKAAYRSLVKKYHPDVNKTQGAEELFKKVQNAYETLLSSPNTNSNSTSTKSKSNATDFFLPEDWSYRLHGTPTFNLRLSVEEVFFCTVRSIKYTQEKKCATCNGLGVKYQHECKTCKGSGKRSFWHKIMNPDETRICPTCNGHGKVNGPSCKTCNGSKTIKKPKIVKLRVDPNVTHNQYLQYLLDGRQYVKLHVIIEKHPYFFVEPYSSELHTKKELTLEEAMNGTEFTIMGIDGKVLLIKVPPRNSFTSQLKVANQGFRINGDRGNLVVELTTQFPKK